MSKSNKDFNALGYKSKVPEFPDKNTLEKVNNPKIDLDYNIRFTCPEFTSICPVTKQPDFANFIIDYVPNLYIVESKSFKLFIQSFRNQGIFHEEATLMIGKSLNKSLKPKWIRILGYFASRGGIPIDVFWQTSRPPSGIFLPDINNNMLKLNR